MISTHVLDTSKGMPAAGIPVKLQRKSGAAWKDLENGTTNADGRHVFGDDVSAGVYQIIFDVENYLKKESKDFFYSQIPVIFKIENTQRKFHVPLLLNPFGYSTYRGS
ncbi:MAG: hydroxyisourate hydrolase [Bdellovibrionales bacterium]